LTAIGGWLASGAIVSARAEEEFPMLPPIMIDGLMYPPGYRLGISLAGVLQPGHNLVWSELASEDYTLLASFHLQGRGPDDNEDIWWDHTKTIKWRLESSEKLDGNIERQVFVDPKNDEAKRGNAAFFVSYRMDGLFEGLDLRTVGPADLGWVDPTNTAYKRWRPTMERILASARLRDPVSVPQLMSELAYSVDFGGYFPRHRGSELILTPRPPDTPGMVLPDDGVITINTGASMKVAPLGSVNTRDDLVASMAKLTKTGGGRQLTYNGIEWFIPPEFDARRNELAWTDADGIGQTRGVGMRAWYAKPYRDATLAVFDGILKSFRFL
jgi:hypothetical protein